MTQGWHQVAHRLTTTGFPLKSARLLIGRLNQEGLTILLVEQNVAQSLELADAAHVMEQGSLVLSGTGTELAANSELAKTYFDVPRLRTATSDSYLTTGLAFAFRAHRDTWFSTPQSQLNWWIPVYDMTYDNCLAFHSRYWDKPIQHTSAEYNYYRWNKESRAAAATMVGTDTRKQPQATEPLGLDPQVRIISPVGRSHYFLRRPVALDGAKYKRSHPSRTATLRKTGWRRQPAPITPRRPFLARAAG